MIDDIDFVVNRHGYITEALQDREGQLAIFMCMLQIGETLNKIDKDTAEKFDFISDVKGSYSVRNFIAHDYEGVQLSRIEDIIRNRLPSLKEKLQKVCN
jgi:uncharacterized protein with HEPN domain